MPCVGLIGNWEFFFLLLLLSNRAFYRNEISYCDATLYIIHFSIFTSLKYEISYWKSYELLGNIKDSESNLFFIDIRNTMVINNKLPVTDEV